MYRFHTLGRPAALAAALAFVAGLGGCGADGGSGDGATTVRDTLPSGTSRVVTVPAAEPGWTLQEELRVGTTGDGSPDSFAQIKGLAPSSEGRNVRKLLRDKGLGRIGGCTLLGTRAHGLTPRSRNARS